MKLLKQIIIPLTILLIIGFESCKKTEEDDFIVCGGCSNSEISGIYTGNGQYYTDENQEVSENTDVKLNLNNLENNLFEAKVEVLDKFSKTYFMQKEEGSAVLTISGTNKSLNLTIYKKNNEYRINGTAKVYHIQGDSLFLDHSVSFTVFK